MWPAHSPQFENNSITLKTNYTKRLFDTEPPPPNQLWPGTILQNLLEIHLLDQTVK